MELHISDTTNSYDTYDYMSYNKQSSEKENTTTKPKKKVAFRDILSNMNLSVNNQGVLQIMPKIQEINEDDEDYYDEPIQPTKNIQPINNTQPHHIEPSVKHSYIYNKYFKDYVSQQIEIPNIRVPKTIEEYHQMLMDDQKKIAEERARVEQFKSRKLLFTCNPGATESKDPRQIRTSSGHLKSMRFT